MRIKNYSLLAIFIIIITCHFSLAEDQNMGSVPKGSGIGQMPETKEVTRLGKNPLIAEYMPLDKGNVWTYEVQKDGTKSEHRQKIVSESGGWSVFDNYFGKQAASLRIAPGGELLVTSGGVVSSFYTEQVVVQFPEEPVKTPSGSFTEAMVVTIPEGEDFWFRDVYIKGVGLVYHERKSHNNKTSYTLINAKVGGTGYVNESR